MTTSRDYSATPLGKKLGAKPGTEVLVLFTTSRAELTRRFSKLTDLDFDAVQRIGLDAGLVDNKSAAVDEQWQAVRFVYRLADRG
jgi:hypothetical protein